MRPELREKILAYNRDRAKKQEMAADLARLVQRIKPILSLISPMLPDEVKEILCKYDDTAS